MREDLTHGNISTQVAGMFVSFTVIMKSCSAEFSGRGHPKPLQKQMGKALDTTE